MVPNQISLRVFLHRKQIGHILTFSDRPNLINIIMFGIIFYRKGERKQGRQEEKDVCLDTCMYCLKNKIKHTVLYKQET